MKSLNHSAVRANAVAFTGHTLSVYLCSLHLSPWLAGEWFRRIAPMLSKSNGEISVPAGDWYLQHLFWITVLPALMISAVGAWVIAYKAISWVWVLPATVLIYKMLVFKESYSVLTGPSISPLRYYFEVQSVMPTESNFLTVDTRRVLAQMTITAPFFAGVAYSLGASFVGLIRGAISKGEASPR